MKFGNVENYGVLNLGKIVGDVTTNITKSFENTDNNNELSKVQDELVKLAKKIDEHKHDIEDPEKTLKCVENLAIEVTSPQANETLINAYLDVIKKATGKVPAILKDLSAIKALVTGILGFV